MGLFKKITLFFILFTCLNLQKEHKYYISTSQIVYSEKSHSIQVITKVFTDDLQLLLTKRYHPNLKLNPDNNPTDCLKYIKRYLKNKFSINVNRKNIPFDFIGKKYENDQTLLYLEFFLPIDSIKTITIKNALLTDLFEEQKNINHFRWNNFKKSYLLEKDKKYFNITF